MGRKKKAVEIEPCPQHSTPDNTWDANAGEFRWLPEVEEKKWSEANRIRAEKDAHAEVAAKSYQRKIKAERATTFDVDSAESPKPEEAKKLLIESGIDHEHVASFLTEVYPVASAAIKIPTCNRYTYQTGPIEQALELGLIDKKSPILDDSIFDDAEAMEKERLLLPEDLRGLWNYSGLVGYYKDKSPEVWLKDRYDARHSLYYLAETICGCTLDPAFHKKMCDFFGTLDDSKLPREYTQDDVRILMRDGFTGPTVRLLWSWRGSYKSTIGMLFISMLITICPDIPTLILTGFKDLGELFMRDFKKLWIVKNPSRPTRWQSLFPEFCVPESKAGAAGSFNSPMSKNFAKEDLVSFAASNSGLGGAHYLYIAGDDFVLPKNSTEELRPGLMDKYLQAKELLTKGGHITLVGTPYYGGTAALQIEGDLYHELLRQSAESGGDLNEQAGGFLSIPAWTVKPGFEDVDIHDLTAEMVDLTRKDGRLTFNDLKGDLGTSLKLEINFRRQKLCQGCPDPSEETLHIFSEDLLAACLEHESQLPTWASIALNTPNWAGVSADPTADAPGSYSMWDLAYSANPTSDESASADLIRAVDPQTGLSHLFVTRMWSDRLGTAEIALQMLRSFQASLDGGYKYKTMIVEKMQGHELLREKVVNEARIRSMTAPPNLYFCEIDRQTDAKNLRIRALQILIHSRRIHFMAGGSGLDWWDKLKLEFLKFDGKKSTTKKQDNLIDCIALAAKHLHIVGTDTSTEEPAKPLTHDEQKAAFIRQRESEQLQLNREYLRQMHQIRFPDYDTRPTAATNEPPVNPYSPRGIMEQYRKRIGR
jgi:hypothetical protein